MLSNMSKAIHIEKLNVVHCDSLYHCNLHYRQTHFGPDKHQSPAPKRRLVQCFQTTVLQGTSKQILIKM